MARITQNDKVLQYIKTFGSITQLEALRDLSCMRLASRISDLKRMGYPIHKTMVEVTNRFGETCNVASYSLREETT